MKIKIRKVEGWWNIETDPIDSGHPVYVYYQAGTFAEALQLLAGIEETEKRWARWCAREGRT